MKKLNKKTLLNLKNKLSNIDINKFMLNNLNKYSINHQFRPIKLHSRTVKLVPFRLKRPFNPKPKGTNSNDNNVRLKAEIKQIKNELQR